MIQYGCTHPLLVMSIIFLLLVCMLWGWYAQQRIFARLSAPEYRAFLFKNYSFVRRAARFFLYGCGILCLGYALMRPQQEKIGMHRVTYGRDVFIALDVSRSMLAQDCLPDRLTCAKQKIRALVNLLHADRVGLVVFSATAVMLCPLTRDHATFLLFLESIDQATLSASGTQVASAISTVLESLQKLGDETRSSALVIVSDGEDFSQESADLVAQASKQGIAVSALGIGTLEGAPLPEYTDQGIPHGYIKDEHGSLVISVLDEAALKKLVKSGGLYVRSSGVACDDDCQQLAAWLERFEKTYRNEQQKGYDELYFYSAVCAACAFAVSWIL